MKYAIGMIETYGHTAATEALDSAFKASNIFLPSLSHIGGGIVTVVFFGDVAAVRVAVDCGVAAAEKVGKVLASHVIARLDEQVISSVLGYKDFDNNLSSNDNNKKDIDNSSDDTKNSKDNNVLVSDIENAEDKKSDISENVKDDNVLVLDIENAENKKLDDTENSKDNNTLVSDNGNTEDKKSDVSENIVNNNSIISDSSNNEDTTGENTTPNVPKKRTKRKKKNNDDSSNQ